ncbi:MULTISPECIES: iron-containing alcohol dehydrogenase [Gordonibacter]|uniref:Iron-containing alcohol dehydrogenase n=1 Tax=Gordonibacter faecis TaxID=3047475 RepID=A0ABT7DJZ4_9ACTN|nr:MULTISPECIES: iron-containing alcohol dehydrogenase [unclassified Gordonibacter]MDJ1649717.1 iron-containing alcohol dehydrogenase [Gordonibacter sp. KGMB12511]HIW76521.1 iron-containing alcohol dehydrogenase [Candidatus Gordonibacter avicola]
MQGFEFACPTKIVCGKHALDKLPDELADRGVARPLVMTDAGLVKLGVAAKLTAVLDAAGVAYEVFDQVPPDSSMDVVNEVARLYTERGCDGFVAIGGGSVIDTTKGAAASLACAGVDFATLQGSEILKADLPPFIAVPTTAGTGSEVTLVAVVADTQKHAKLSFTSYKLVPHVAVLDPALTASLPPKLTATTGMDALTHAIEAYTSIQKNPVSDAFAVKAIELIAENLPVACRDGANVDARTSLALASLMAGAAFSNAMVGIVHALGHSLGGLCHIPHGQAMMMLLPHCVRYNLNNGIHAGLYGELLPYVAPARAADLGVGASAAERDRAFGEHLFALNNLYHEQYGVPLRLSELGVTREGLPTVAKQARYDGAALYNETEITLEVAMEILEAAY